MRRFSKLLPGSTWCLSSWFLSLTSPVTFFVFFFIFFLFYSSPYTSCKCFLMSFTLSAIELGVIFWRDHLSQLTVFSQKTSTTSTYLSFLKLRHICFAAFTLSQLPFFLLYGFRVYNSVWYSHSLSLSLFFGSAL